MRGTIYNSTTEPLPYDAEGHMLEAGGTVKVPDVDAEFFAADVKAERFIVCERAAAEAAEQQAAQAEDTTKTPAKTAAAKTTTTRGTAATQEG